MTFSATMKEAGFYRLKVKATIAGKDYEGWGTAAFSPEKLKPFAQNLRRNMTKEEFLKEMLKDEYYGLILPDSISHVIEMFSGSILDGFERGSVL